MNTSAFSDACKTLYAPGLSLRNLTDRSFAFLRRLVSAEFIAEAVLDIRSRRLRIGFDVQHNAISTTMKAFGALMGRYDLYRFDPTVNGGRPFCRSHFYSECRFRDLDIYQEVYRPLGVDNHCAIHVPTRPGEVLFFGVERAKGPDFSAEELALLSLAQDHLTNAHALAAMEIAHEIESVEPELLTRAGLTPREAEALFWISEGKSNSEIAILLGISLYTVKDHVASIFNKTGVGNRMAAVVWARETCTDLRRKSADPESFVEVPARLPTPSPPSKVGF